MKRILERNRVSVLGMDICGVWERLHSASVRYHALATIQVAWSCMYNGLELVRPLLSQTLLSHLCPVFRSYQHALSSIEDCFAACFSLFSPDRSHET
jgi:hypothetical protein